MEEVTLRNLGLVAMGRDKGGGLGSDGKRKGDGGS